MKKELIIIFVLFLSAGCLIFLLYGHDNRISYSTADKKALVERMPDCSVAEQKRSACVAAAEGYKKLKQEIVSGFTGKVPLEWGQKVAGVKTQLVTDKKAIALTFDADSGDYDSGLIDYLKREKVPATLFVTGKWIDEHPDIFQELSDNRMFEIENHGSNHKPCSVNGKSAYQIKGTSGVSDVFYEIEQNARKIEILTGRKTEFYRPGTAFLDEVCVQIAEKLGYKVVNYNILGDAGATFSAEKIKEELLSSEKGSVALLHMNHPEKDIAKGVMEAVPELRKRGFEFVKLSGYELK